MESVVQKKEIINQKSKIKTHHGKERNLEQGIASNHYGTNRHSNHLRGNLMHGHVTKQERV